MAKLQIRTSLDSVVVCGEFCGWDMGKAVRAERVSNSKYITVADLPRGEYKVFSCASFMGSEKYPTTGRDVPNRYFDGTADELISVFFNKYKGETKNE